MTFSEDYVTVLPTQDPYLFLVVVMKYHLSQDDYTQTRCSQLLRKQTADALAKSWAAAMKLEIR